MFYDIRPRSTICLAIQKGITRGLEITYEYGKWITDNIKLWHGNNCSIKAETFE